MELTGTNRPRTFINTIRVCARDSYPLYGSQPLHGLRRLMYVFYCMVFRFSGGHSGRETPGPIPNPVVKPSNADGTARGIVWESKTLPEYLILFPPFFGGRNVCGCITLQPAWLEGDTPTHAYPRISLGPSQTVTDYRSHYWPGCRGIRVAWYYTIDPCVAMPRGRHG